MAKPDKFEMMTCNQCGEYKHKSQFRNYPGHKESFYRQCLTCESINKRYAYLKKKETNADLFAEELGLIEAYYASLRAKGLQVPGDQRTHGMVDKLKALVQAAPTVEAVEVAEDIPEPIREMLTIDFLGSSVDDLYERYDSLKNEYAPRVGFDDDMKPMYETKYKEYLDAILQRIAEYEDQIGG